MNSPVRPTLPCKYEKRNGTLDIAALPPRTEGAASFPTARRWQQVGEHGHLAAHDATDGALCANQRHSGLRAKEQNGTRMIWCRC